MKQALLLLAAILSATASLSADTIYQANPQGKPVVIQRDAIVVSEDSVTLAYKHFDLKDRRVVKVVLSKGSLPYTVDASNAAARQQIVSNWKRFGYTATVVDQAGKSARVADLYLDFYPPGGRGSLLESIPPRTNVPILIDGGGADELDFSKIDHILVQGAKLAVTLRDGHTITGQFLMPTDKPAEVRVLGITDQYDPASGDVFDFSQPLGRVKEIRFE
ncbi:MAG TPA: hypothetical protein VG204_20095 [Terriglobia bacterium]|nr:hypothetical protein [Terriglobia bacterium]